MQFIAGICAKGHPNCFSQTYTYKGIYGRISRFELTLARRFVHAGRKVSLVNAECPAGAGSSQAVVPLARFDLTYARAFPRTQIATGTCEVSSPRPHHHKN
jgi:hypothetical protein